MNDGTIYIGGAVSKEHKMFMKSTPGQTWKRRLGW
jgi:hypothetical protein